MATDYTTYITSQHADKPKFVATVQALTQGVGAIIDAVTSLPAKFDLDLAEGKQLDATGEWIGVGRTLSAPIPNTWFSFDTPGKGWDQGYWKEPFAPTEGVVSLDDTSYRAALHLKIAANHWRGDLGSYSVYPVLLERSDPNLILMVDNQDMSMDVYVLGVAPSLFLQLVIQQEQLIPKPFGVRINSYVFTDEPVFGVDYSTLMIDGPDRGYFLT